MAIQYSLHSDLIPNRNLNRPDTIKYSSLHIVGALNASLDTCESTALRYRNRLAQLCLSIQLAVMTNTEYDREMDGVVNSRYKISGTEKNKLRCYSLEAIIASTKLTAQFS